MSDTMDKLAEQMDNMAEQARGLTEVRENASAVFESTAKRLRREADDLDALARVAASLKAGSPEEKALWMLAVSARRNAF